MVGPVERMLAARLSLVLGADVEVERTGPGAPAEFRFDVRPVIGDDAGRDEVKAMAAAVEAVDGVDSAFAIPPRVYLRVDTPSIVDAAVAAALTDDRRYGWAPRVTGPPVISSIGCPNANKPLHIGHLRNVFLGFAVSRLFETQGHDVVRTEELANYGIHICQALVAYERWGIGADPESAHRKPDHFVGDFYTRFHRERALLLGADADREQPDADDDEAAEAVAPTELDVAASELLLRMDGGSAADLAINERVTEWAIDGIRATYRRIGLHHDFVLRELEALPDALALVASGLEDGICVRRADGSVYVDLTDCGLGEVTLLRRDGTALALVCFVAIWVRRAQLHPEQRVIRVTGEQWRESFTQFLEILRRLGHERTSALTEGVYYGMIRTPEGKLGSRSGHDAAADDLLDRYRELFAKDWLAVLPGGLAPYHHETCERLAVAALKLFVLAKRREDTIVFDPDGAWQETVPRMSRLLAARALVEGAIWRADDGAPARPPNTGAKAQRAARELALAINALPRAFERGLQRRDSSELVGYLDDLARKAALCARAGALTSTLAAALGVVLRNGLWTLGVDLPSSARELPPCCGQSTRRSGSDERVGGAR